jgi:Flp pilus assembly protein TadB
MTAVEQERESEAPRLTALVGDILDDAGRLVSQQAALFRAEVREDFRRTATAVQYIGFGLAVGAVGGLFLCVAAVYGLVAAAPTLPIWACWAIIGGTLFLAGVVATLVGRHLVKSFNPLPEKSLAALEENVSCITQHRD